MKRAILAVLAAALIASPALAEDDDEVNPNWDLDFSSDGIINDIATNAWDWEAIISPAPETMFAGFTAEGMAFELSEQPLSYFQNAFGGPIQEKWSVGYHHTWLCYTAGDQRIWYITDGDSETIDGAIVDWIVQEPASAATNAQNGCTEQPLAQLTQPQGFPAIGATLADINTRFGTSLPEGTTRAAFQLHEDAGSRTAYYRLKDGVVDGISFARWVWRE